MSKHYNHTDVPEEISKKFPNLQGKVFGNAEIPAHV